MKLIDRIGIDFGRRLPAEEAVAWAAGHGVRYADIQIDVAPNQLETFDAARCAGLRKACEEGGVHLGLHTLSAVNVAEISPFMRDAVDQYLRAYIDVAKRLKAEWVVVHAGYHFTADRKVRMEASRERIKRAVGYAEEQGVLLLLENMNWEPDLAEVHYLGHTIEEALYYFDAIQSPHLGWSFTVNHATLVPAGIDGFLDAMPFGRCREVRLADNNGEYEIHMKPGEGIIDFGATFKRIEGQGFDGHYMNAWGTVEDMYAGRDYMVRAAAAAGVKVD